MATATERRLGAWQEAFMLRPDITEEEWKQTRDRMEAEFGVLGAMFVDSLKRAARDQR